MSVTKPTVSTTFEASMLKARFKQRCTATGNVHQNWQIRVHRAISWLKRAGEFTDEQVEARYLFLWIALNSLYSRWDNERNMPGPDSQARDDFIRRVCQWDKRLVIELLQQSRGLVMKLLENAFLAADFWRQPDHPEAKKRSARDAKCVDTHLRNGDACTVMIQAMHRLFLFRGQLVHGASSGGSRLNRGSVKYCLWTLDKFVPVLIHVVIEHGCHDDWPELCYPPIKD